MRYSIQQIKYDFLYAIKEFDSDGTQWGVTTSDLPPAETLARDGRDPAAHVFLGKPAGTARAAALVQDFFASRFGVRPVSRDGAVPGEWVILFRNRASLPQEADMLQAES